LAATETIRVPDIGDTDEVEVVEVLVAAGDRVGVDDPLITLESDKASMDVPSPLAGEIKEVKVSVGDKVGEGAAILILEVEEASGPAGEEAEATAGQPAEPGPAEPGRDGPGGGESGEAPGEAPDAPTARASKGGGARAAPSPTRARRTLPPIDEEGFARAYAGPAVRRFARELGVDLGRVEGTGRNGRIVRQDVREFVKRVMAGETAAGAAGPSAGSLPGIEIPEMPKIDFTKFGEIERRPLSRIQRISGPNLHRSWLHVPHVTQHDEADVTDLEQFRQENKAKAREEGFSLTPLAFIMKAVVSALEEFPTVNSTLDVASSELVLKKYYHLGVAVDTRDGLIVPVIREVDRKGIFDIARELAEVSAAAREGKLKLDQLQGASFTVTSLGGIGGTAFTPIVNAPEVGILGVSRSYMKPVWQPDGEGGGEFVPHLMLPLSFSYDHRAIDGATAVRFTTFLCQELADIRKLLL
jgi:pyruvate dehydrogenase E2 component (dihydrolipoamide acetyltransferase)